MSDTDSVISSSASFYARSICSSNSNDSSTIEDIICTDLGAVRKTSQLRSMPELCDASVIRFNLLTTGQIIAKFNRDYFFAIIICRFGLANF